MHSLPVFLRLTGRPVILLGDNEAAEAKRRLLERAGANIVSEDVSAQLAIVALDDPGPAAARLKARGILVNAVDRPDLCDFTLPAIVDRDPVLVAIGTGGVSAGLAAALRQRLEAFLSPKVGELALLLFEARDDLRRVFPNPSERRLAIARALMPDGVLDLGDPFLEDPFWIDHLQKGSDWSLEFIRLHSPDPDELTLRQARFLGLADRIFHRDNVPVAILNRTRADAVRIACDVAPNSPGPGLSLDISMGAE